VGAGDGNAAPFVHEGRYDVGAVEDGEAAGFRGGNFGVAAGDGGGYHDGFGVLDVGGVVADEYFGAELLGLLTVSDSAVSEPLTA
jgi:hypothetical protein